MGVEYSAVAWYGIVFEQDAPMDSTLMRAFLKEKDQEEIDEWVSEAYPGIRYESGGNMWVGPLVHRFYVFGSNVHLSTYGGSDEGKIVMLGEPSSTMINRMYELLQDLSVDYTDVGWHAMLDVT